MPWCIPGHKECTSKSYDPNSLRSDLVKGCGLVIEGFQDFTSLGLGDELLPLGGIASVPVVAIAQFVRG